MKRIALMLMLLTGCRADEVVVPDPVTMTAETVGYYCQMNVLEHPGPKAQLHLEGQPGKPLFFSQVRDAVAYQRMPEQSHAIQVIYVNDIGAAASWEETGADNWIRADTAVYVVGSARVGGMGAPELVPFSDPAKAAAFAVAHGGQVVTLAAIADADVLRPVASEGEADSDGDYAERLRKLSGKVGG